MENLKTKERYSLEMIRTNVLDYQINEDEKDSREFEKIKKDISDSILENIETIKDILIDNSLNGVYRKYIKVRENSVGLVKIIIGSNKNIEIFTSDEYNINRQLKVFNKILNDKEIPSRISRGKDELIFQWG